MNPYPDATALSDFLASLEPQTQLRVLIAGGPAVGKRSLVRRLREYGEPDCGDDLAQRAGDGGCAPGFYQLTSARRQLLMVDLADCAPCAPARLQQGGRADLALLLVEAQGAVDAALRYQLFVLSLLGVSRLILVVNKMDAVVDGEALFQRWRADCLQLATSLGLEHLCAIPVSALKDDNLTRPSQCMPWYDGLDLLQTMDQIEADPAAARGAMRMPVQSVQRLDGDLCLYAGSLVSGSVRPGDLIRAQPSGQEARVREIVVFQGQLEQAVTGQAVALRLEPALEIARGAVIAAANRPLEVADQFQVDLIWCADEPLLPGRSYLLKTGNQTLDASITEIKHQIDPLTLDTRPAKILARYAIGRCNLQLDREIPFAPYGENRQLGGFQLLERQSQATLACGMIRFALRRASNIHLQAMSLDRAARARMKGQSPRVLWFTGLSGSGKSTIANVLEQQLHAQGYHTYLLDGDNVRHGLNKDLGFTDADRVENIRRIGEVARLMVDAGLIVITAFISPFRAERDMVRALFAAGEFVEIFVDTPLQLAEARDPKGLYHKARSGQLKNFTGIDSAYEIPETPELRLETTLASPLENTGHIIEWLRTHP